MESESVQIVMLMNSGISLVMGLYMLFIRKDLKNGVNYWAVGSLLIALSLFLRFVILYLGFSSLVIPTILISIGLYLYLAGILKFKGKSINKWLIYGLPILDLIQSVISYNILGSYRLELGLHVLFILIYCCLCIYEMFELKEDQKYLRRIFRINAFPYIVFMALMLLSFVVIFLKSDFNPLKYGSLGVFVHILSGFIMIAITFGFIMAVNIKLNKELQEQLEERNKIFSIIAHDLRSPLGTIMSFLDLLDGEYNLTEENRKKYFGIIRQLSESTFHLLQNLLQWTRKTKHLNQNELERIAINQLVADDIGLHRNSALLKSIHMEFKPEDQEFYIKASSNMIKTILNNFISNAIKFTDKGGRIGIQTRRREDMLELLVSDTGRGMDAEKCEAIVQGNWIKSTSGTQGESGSGIGLSLCREFIDYNKGNLKIESQPGLGTSFIITFPLVK